MGIRQTFTALACMALVACSSSPSDPPDQSPGASGPPSPESVANLEPESIIDVGETPGAMDIGFGSVWVGSHRGAKVVRLDPASERITAIDAGGNVIGTVAGAGGVWYLAWTAKRLEKIDPKTNKVVARIDVDSEGGDFEVDGDILWFAGTTKIYKIDGRTNEIVDEIPCAEPGPSCAIDVYRGSLWALEPEATKLVRLVKGKGTSVGRIDLGPGAFTVDSFFDDMWASYPDEGAVRRFDIETGALIAEVRTGDHPDWLAEGDGTLYVRTSDRGIAAIDPATNEIVETYEGLPPAEAPIGAVVFYEGFLWASNFTDGTVWKIAP